MTIKGGIEFHLDAGGVSGDARSLVKATRQTEAACNLVKLRDIQQIIR